MGPRTGGGGGKPQISPGGTPPGAEPPLNTPEHDAWAWEKELQQQIEDSRQRRQKERDTRGYPKTEERIRQRQWEEVKNYGKPLNSNQNAAYNTILHKWKRGEPIHPSDVHKATFKTLVKNGYITPNGKPVINPSTGKPYFKGPITKKQWQQSQEATYERIFGKSHPRAEKRNRDKWHERPSGEPSKGNFVKLLNDLKKMQKR